MTTIITILAWFFFVLLMFIYFLLAIILPIIIKVLLVAFIAYACILLFTIPPKHRKIIPQHKIGLFLATLVLPYLLFPVFVTDFAVAGAGLRHDVIALNAWNRTWLWGILLLINLPLLPLFQAACKRDWAYLALVRRLCLIVWATFLVASAFTLLANKPIISATWQFLFQHAYFWWDWALVWLEIDGVRTTQELARPMFRYEYRGWEDMFCLMLAMLPLLLFYREKLAEERED